MKKLSGNIRKTILAATGKALALCGVAITFAACYGTPPRDYPNAPDYWAPKNNAEEAIFGADEQQTSQLSTSDVTREKYEEMPEEQAFQNEQPAL